MITYSIIQKSQLEGAKNAHELLDEAKRKVEEMIERESEK